MRKIAFLLVALIAAAAVSTAATVNKQRFGTVDLYGWTNMELSGQNFSTMTVSGGSPELKTTDGRLYAKADKMSVQLYSNPKGKKRPAGQSAIKNAELTGNVTFSVRPEPNKYIKGSGAKLTIIGAENKAILDGGGKVIQVEAMDPDVFDQPTILRGEQILVNLNRHPAPDEWRIKAVSSQDKSHLSVTPKPKPETETPKTESTQKSENK